MAKQDKDYGTTPKPVYTSPKGRKFHVLGSDTVKGCLMVQYLDGAKERRDIPYSQCLDLVNRQFDAWKAKNKHLFK